MNKKYRAIIIEDKGDSAFRLTEELRSKGHEVLFDAAIDGADGDMTFKDDQISREIGKEQELRENEEKYRQLFHHSTDAVFVIELTGHGLSGKLIEVNETACSLFGYTREELFQMGAKDIFNVESNGDYRAIMKSMSDNSRATFEITALTKDRKTINIELRVHKFKFKGKYILMEMMHDITDKVKIISELKASTTKYEYLLMNMNNAYGYFKVVTGNDGSPVDCINIEMNEAFSDVIGISKADAAGRSILSSFPLKEVVTNSFFRSLVRVAFYGEQYISNDLYIDYLGKWFSAYAYSPEKGFFALILIDISDQKKAAETMKRGLEAAKTASRAKSEFLANMSHEIRTPLNGIIGMTNLTLLTELSRQQRDNLMIVKNSADALLNVINDILDLSKMEAGKLDIEKITFDIRNELEKVVKAHSVKANEKGLDFRYLVDKRIPKLLKGDPYRLQQILNNLVGNAIKFTETGCIKMVVEHIGKSENTHSIKYAVIDTGIGIAEHDLNKLFKNFSQIDSSYTKRFNGTGLGLAITKQLAEMMGGTIDVKSERGKGSIFECILKFEAGEEDDSPGEEEEFQMKKSLLSLNILIVEDDSINQTITEIMLKRMGHKTQIAENGKKALELYETGNFDLILMDIQLPEMDGIQATKIIRRKESLSGRHTPIIAFTAYALKGDKERFLEAGMDEYIIKPFKINELYSIIENVSKKFKNNNKYGEMQYEPVYDGVKTVKEDFSVTDIGSEIERLTSCAAIQDVNQIEKDAHQLKKAASALGMGKIRVIAFRIELAARREDMNEIESLIKELANADRVIDECTY